MDTQELQIDVHREPDGYWAEVRQLPGCFASGHTLDELLAALHEAIALYTGDPEPERILIRLTTLTLEIQPDLRPGDADQLTRQAARRQRRAHRDDWPPQRS